MVFPKQLVTFLRLHRLQATNPMPTLHRFLKTSRWKSCYVSNWHRLLALQHSHPLYASCVHVLVANPRSACSQTLPELWTNGITAAMTTNCQQRCRRRCAHLGAGHGRRALPLPRHDVQEGGLVQEAHGGGPAAVRRQRRRHHRRLQEGRGGWSH